MKTPKKSNIIEIKNLTVSSNEQTRVKHIVDIDVCITNVLVGEKVGQSLANISGASCRLVCLFGYIFQYARYDVTGMSLGPMVTGVFEFSCCSHGERSSTH